MDFSKLTATSYTGELVFGTDGKPSGVQNVEQSLTGAVIDTVMRPLNGGATFSTGLGATLGELGKLLGGHIILDFAEDKLGRNLNPTR